MFVPCKNIPTYTYETNTWSTTSFEDQKELGDFLYNTCFKEPGEYYLDESTKDFDKEGRTFTENGRYTEYSFGTTEYNDYWDNEKLKCRLGVIWKHKDKTWYLTRDYYFLLNFCPILNKEKGSTETFMSIRDVQLHMMLYEKIAECYHLHSCVLKRRQMAYSNCHVAKSLNFIWFENKKTIKWFASKESYINAVDGSWKMLDAIRNHLNANTDWIRIFTPAEYPKIQQKEKFLVKKGQWGTKGNESTLSAKPLTHDPTSGVGGAAFWIWHEEGGVAPKANTTLQYINPALESGLSKIGSFHIGGSVGDLEDCEPLKKFILEPDTYEMFKVPCRWVDDTNVIKEYGLFIPVQYGMPEAVDEFGNSQVEKALTLLTEYEEKWKLLPTADYVLRKSQNPKTVKEAFAWRNVSFFNVQRIERRQKTIELLKEQDEWEEKQGLLEVNNKGEIVLKHLNSFPEHDRPTPMGYPVDPKQKDKRGCVTIWEEPEDDVQPGTFFAGVDSVEVGYTDTSDSLTSITIYKRGCKIIKTKGDGTKEVSYERGKIVASYAGRFNNPKDHNEQGLLLLRKYKALAACERNRPNFINYCRDKGYSHLIARRSEMPFNKDLDATGWKNDEFGVYSGNDKELLKKIKQALYEHIDSEIETFHKTTKDDSIGDVVKTIRGYDIVKDYWLLEELKLYNDDSGNFDRCFTKGNLVQTSDSLIDISDVKIGDKVLTHNNNFEIVYELFKNKYEGDLVKIKPLGNDKFIECTPNHPFLVGRYTTKPQGRNWYNRKENLDKIDWVLAKDIKKGDFLNIPKRNYRTLREVEDDVLYLLGWYLSDGNVSRKALRICFQGDQLEMAEKCKQILQKYDKFLPTYFEVKHYKSGKVFKSHTKKKPEPTIKKVKDKYAYNLECCSDWFIDILDKYVTILPEGEKILKPSLYNQENLVPLILGFFEGDGHQAINTSYKNERHSLQLSGTYQTMIRQFRDIILNEGIWCTISPTSARNDNSADQLRIDIQDYEGINKIVKDSLKFKKIDISRKQRKNYIIKDSGFWIPISKIDRASYSGYVYNIEVEKDHSYTVDGISTHNCVSAGLAIILGVSRELDHEKTIYEEDKEDKKRQPTNIKKPINFLPSSRRLIKNLLKR